MYWRRLSAAIIGRHPPTLTGPVQFERGAGAESFTWTPGMIMPMPTSSSQTSGPRIALVGPLPPFRSGIAQHTMMLASALSERSTLLVISMTRQYPRWLFPGQSDVDPDGQRIETSHIRYLIDSLNPLTWERAFRALAEHGPRAVIIPWWTVYWAPCVLYLARRLKRAGIPVQFLCHNVVDHEAAGWKRLLTRAVLRQGSAFLAQSNGERELLQGLVPGRQVAVHPHPIFTQFPQPARDLPRRAGREFLFFGLVRPYKGLDILLRALAVMEDQDVMLTVAGEFWQPLPPILALIDELGISSRVELIPHYIGEQDAAALFHRADAVVMPYRSASGSGVLGLAYHYRKPVIASRISGLSELVLEGVTGDLVAPETAEALADALMGMTAGRARSMSPGIAEYAKHLSWDSLADMVLSQIADRGRSHRGRHPMNSDNLHDARPNPLQEAKEQ